LSVDLLGQGHECQMRTTFLLSQKSLFREQPVDTGFHLGGQQGDRLEVMLLRQAADVHLEKMAHVAEMPV
jgi:hypothetical protein